MRIYHLWSEINHLPKSSLQIGGRFLIVRKKGEGDVGDEQNKIFGIGKAFF